MSTTDSGPDSPTTVGARPGSSAPRSQEGDGARGSGPARTTTAPPRPEQTGEQARTGQPRPAGGQPRPTATAGQPRPGATGGQARAGQTRPGQPGSPPSGAAASGSVQPRPGQPRPGLARPGQARAVQPRSGQARAVARPSPAVRRGPRKARLSLARLDPWSVLKLSFLLSVALGIVGVVVTAVVWNVVDGMGVFEQVNEIVGQVQGEDAAFDVYSFVGFERMLSLSVVISVANVVIITALATLFAFIYNISSGLVGGLHVTLTDE